MWILTIRAADQEPVEHVLQPGVTTIGRRAGSDITIAETSASRNHAELTYNPELNLVALRDLGSTNGTFVNRERLTGGRRLQSGDEIRIGQHVISLDHRETKSPPSGRVSKPSTSPLTRDFLLESLDRHAVLLSVVAERLTTVLDLDTALNEVSALMRRSMGADKCEVLLAERFDRMTELGFPSSIAQMALETRSAVIVPDVGAQPEMAGKSAVLLRVRSALCVPVLSGEEIAALIYVYKTDPSARPFDQRDLQLAVAISYQAALTIQRARLLRRVRREQRLRELLQRFLDPSQAETVLQEYLKQGQLPPMQEKIVSVLFADIRDSTSLAERVGPQAFSQMLTKFYESMTQIVFKQGGLLQQYSGDGLIAVFGWSDQADQAAYAVRAAIDMQARSADIVLDGENIGIGIGVNTGPAVGGYLEIQDRIEFTVLGDTVNVSQRLQSLARRGCILVGPLTQMEAGDHFHFHPIGSIEVKGRTHPVEAFEVTPAPQPSDGP
jgi:adenylate cyclase